jgi:HEAT repeat protein
MVHLRAASILFRLGTEALGALPDLLSALDDKDDDVALTAAQAVWQIDRRPAVLPALTRGLGAKTPELRRRVAESLGRMGTAAKDAVPDSLVASRDSDRNVRRSVIQALRRIDREAAKQAGDPEKDPE